MEINAKMITPSSVIISVLSALWLGKGSLALSVLSR